jgi:uncharacterized protein DUF982
MQKLFARPILIHDRHPSGTRSIGSAREAADYLMSEWPGARDEWHRDAVDTCLKVMEGYRSTIDAERAFREAARRAGILADMRGGDDPLEASNQGTRSGNRR